MDLTERVADRYIRAGLSTSQQRTLEKLQAVGGPITLVETISKGATKRLSYNRKWSHRGFNSDQLNRLERAGYVKSTTRVEPAEGGKVQMSGGQQVLRGPGTVTMVWQLK
jgi:hypothetical protein